MSRELSRSDLLSLVVIPMRWTPELLIEVVEREHEDGYRTVLESARLEDDGFVTVTFTKYRPASFEAGKGHLVPR